MADVGGRNALGGVVATQRKLSLVGCSRPASPAKALEEGALISFSEFSNRKRALQYKYYGDIHPFTYYRFE